MKLEFKRIAVPTDVMRRAGYIFQHRNEEEMSFIRPFGRSGYPRFHVYLKEAGEKSILTIHLDQKKETYGRSARHHGEYEDEGALHQEVEVLKKAIGNESLLA